MGEFKSKKWNLYGKQPTFLPNAITKAGKTEEQLIDEFFLDGYVPDKPFITKEDKIATFGSCFAENILLRLKGLGYNCVDKKYIREKGEVAIPHVIRFGGLLNNTYTVKEHLEWIFEDREFKENTWFDNEANLAKPLDEIKKSSKEFLQSIDVLIITFGVSEVWRNLETNETFWRAVPLDEKFLKNIDNSKYNLNDKLNEKYSEDNYKLVNTTCQENIDNLEKIYSLLKKHCKKDATIIFTVSPIRIRATYRNSSTMVASCATKSILRATMDEVYRNHIEDKNFYYWPGYEIAKEFCSDIYEDDEHHIKNEVVKKVMLAFHRNFCI